MSVRLTRLESGLLVATDRMESVETAALGVWVGVGTRHEPARNNGVAHLLEHMLFKGTERRSAQAIAEEIEAVGGHLNAYTGRETTAYHVTVLADDLPLGLDLVADMMQHSRFDEEEIVRERGVVLQEIGQAEDTPDDIIFDLFQEAAYPDQPMGWPVLGRADVVARLAREDLLDYIGTRYGSERMIVAAAGKVDHDAVVDLAGKAFTGFAPQPLPEAVAEPSYRGGEWREERDLEQVHIILGFEAAGFRAPDYYAAAIASTLLGGGMSSRLFQEVREKRGLCYSVFSFLNAATDSGLFGVYAGTGEQEAAELTPVVCDQLAAVAATGPDEAELRRAKAQLKASVLMGRERSGNRAEHLANQLLVHGRPIGPEEIVAKIEAVEADAVRGCVARMLASPPTLVALGPLGQVESLDAIRARLGSAGR